MYNIPENLRQMDRNTSFLKVVCDRRRGEAPKIRCMTDDLYANFDIKTGMIDFELRNPDIGDPSFWHHWSHIDIDEERIDKIRSKINKFLSRVREII